MFLVLWGYEVSCVNVACVKLFCLFWCLFLIEFKIYMKIMIKRFQIISFQIRIKIAFFWFFIYKDY